MELAYPITVLSDLHVGHPASYITDANQLGPLLGDAATVVFNGDSVEMLWVYNRDHAQEQMEAISHACIKQGARPVFLNGNHDPVISTASHLDLAGGSVLVTHGDILFHDVAPWSREAKVIGPEHTRLLQQLTADAHGDFEERLIAIKRASLALEMHEPKRPTGRLAGLALAAREGWPPWRALWIVNCWIQTPGRAARLAEQFRPQARFVLVGHTHYSGVWTRGDRVVINTGSFLPFSGRVGVRLERDRLEVRAIHRRHNEWHFGRTLRSYELPAGANPDRG